MNPTSSSIRSVPARLQAVASALVSAHRGGGSIDAGPFALEVASAEEAYLVEDALVTALGGFGGPVPTHWKAGAGSRDARPLVSPLPLAGIWPSPASAAAWPIHHGLAAEAEIALRLGKSVTPQQAANLDGRQARSLIDAMAVAIELVDSRWQQAAAAPAWLRLADLQSHSALVLGEWQAWRDRDWAVQKGRIQIGAQAPLDFVGSHTCADPAWFLADWLRHATRRGRVEAGTVVTTGSWVGSLPVARGERVDVVFEGVGGATLQC